jgi:hypothetical protein
LKLSSLNACGKTTSLKVITVSVIFAKNPSTCSNALIKAQIIPQISSAALAKAAVALQHLQISVHKLQKFNFKIADNARCLKFSLVGDLL